MGFRTDRARVSGLGSAKEGTGHFWQQRVTAVALIILAPVFILTFGSALGEGYDTAIATFSRPVPAIIAILMLLVTFTHLKLGLQVVIEDYVHGTMRTPSLILNTFFCYAAAAAGVFGVAAIAL